MQPAWRPAIDKEVKTCFQGIKDVGQRRMMMIWLFSFKTDMTMKARLLVKGKMCKPGLDYNLDKSYYGNVSATSIQVFFVLSALFGLALREGDLVGAYLVRPGSKDFMLCMATPDGIIAPKKNGITGTRKPVWITIFWKEFQQGSGCHCSKASIQEHSIRFKVLLQADRWYAHTSSISQRRFSLV